MSQPDLVTKKPPASLDSKSDATETLASDTGTGTLRSILAGVRTVEPFAVVFLASAITLITVVTVCHPYLTCKYRSA